jgi:hypothetical protein
MALAVSLLLEVSDNAVAVYSATWLDSQQPNWPSEPR